MDKNVDMFILSVPVCLIIYELKLLKSLKTLLEKDKMLVTSIFSISHNVFYPIKDKSNHLKKIK